MDKPKKMKLDEVKTGAIVSVDGEYRMVTNLGLVDSGRYDVRNRYPLDPLPITLVALRIGTQVSYPCNKKVMVF